MTDEEREMDLALAELEIEVRRLRRIEYAAKNVLLAFSGTIDYVVWDKALDLLEAEMKEKP